MKEMLPYVIVRSPAGQERRILLTSTCYTIGRFPDNDIDLPDDRTVITRIQHCVLKREGTVWYLTDSSTNGTVLRRKGKQVEVQSCPNAQLSISSQDVIYIHGWEIIFHDPNQTTPLPGLLDLSRFKPSCPLVYKVNQATLYKVSYGQMQAVNLRPQVRKMVGYMAEKNVQHGESVLCTHEELIIHIWGEDAFKYSRSSQDISGLAKDIRKVFCEVLQQDEWDDPASLLKTIKGEGYSLWITCEA